jgi:hypothetical protein
MAYFDRFDICEAYAALESDYNVGGWLHERPSNRRRSEATHVQLHRLKFKPALAFNGFESLSDNGKEIYSDLVTSYNLPTIDNAELLAWRTETAFHEEGAI